MAQFQKLYDVVRGFSGKSRVAHVRHFLWEVEQSLLLEVEFGRQSTLFRVVQAEALADEFESAGNCQRRGSENHSVKRLEQFLAENLADVDWRGGKEHTFVAPLEPVDIVL